MMKETVGHRAADALVEEREEQSHLETLGGQAVGIAALGALDQAMGSELSQVIAKLAKAITVWGQGVAG